MNPDSISREPSELVPRHPTFSEAFRFWVKLGFISFGGPSGQIAIMHAELVEKKRWISEARFLHALNFCMLLPGPEATQLAIYVGWLLHKTLGGIVAGAFFVIPSMLILWILSVIYVRFGNLPWIAAIFYGLKPAVVAIVAAAVLRIGNRALKNSVMWTLAVLAFVAIYWFKTPFPVIIVAAGLIGLVGGKFWRTKFLVFEGHGKKPSESPAISDQAGVALHTRPSLVRAIKVLIVSLLLWSGPLLLVAIRVGPDHVIFREGVFFSKAAMVTFGGAYAVLPYVSQQAVESYQWLSAAQMLDGLGLAETTPGPLIMVLQFVGFLGAWNHPGTLNPLLAATFGALITTWSTFVPCFLWIFVGAPHIEQLRGNVKLTTSLSAVTSAVVGVILNLAVWFGVHVLFPSGRGIDLFAMVVSVGAFVGMQVRKWSILPVIFGAGLCGLVYRVLFL